MATRTPKSPPPSPPLGQKRDPLLDMMAELVDPDWYTERYPDILTGGFTPVEHFVHHGLAEGRDPNPWFECRWYAITYPDVASSGLDPLTHYMRAGAVQLRNPGPKFDAEYYVEVHPKASANPLLFHCRTGHHLGYGTAWAPAASDYLPASTDVAPAATATKPVDIILVAAPADAATRRSVAAVLADTSRQRGQLFVVASQSVSAGLLRWLETQHRAGALTLQRQHRRQSNVAALNAAIEAAGTRDVVLLDGAATLPDGWLSRLAAQAHAEPRIATVSPFTDGGGWCGYPARDSAGAISGFTSLQIDAACQTVNRGRSVRLPAGSRCCLYIRREAFRRFGLLDPESPGSWHIEFGARIAANGWQNRLACDTYVTGAVAADADDEREAEGAVRRRYPGISDQYDNDRRRDAAAPFRFAVTARLMASSDLPVIVMATHYIGGGVRRHIDILTERIAGKAHVMLLRGWVTEGKGATKGKYETDIRLSVATVPDHPEVKFASNQVDDMVAVLRSANVSRVHIHHLLWFEFDTRAMILRLGVPFDVTIHDNYVLCPQLNMLPQATSFYCGGPDLATCNACIAISPSAIRARDILSWRLKYAWLFTDADRVICPSQDMKQRLERFVPAGRAMVVPHEPVTPSDWPLTLPKLTKAPLRVVLLGTLANHKGSRIVAPVVETAPSGLLDVHCIGELEDTFPPEAAALVTATGRYSEEELAGLIRKVRPHVIWLPSVAPESYSYTLTAAIDAGLPIVATRFGAFTERLAGRPYTWLVDYDAPTETWLDTFKSIREALNKRPTSLPKVPRPPVADFYAEDYIVPRPSHPLPMPLIAHGATPVISVVAEKFTSGHLSPCAFIRLLQPFSHPAIRGDATVVMDTAETALARQADVIVTQRHAVPDRAAADALIAHARRTGAALVYDLDDDLLTIPPTHPDAGQLRPKAKIVRQMLEAADAVWLASPGLMERLERVRPDAQLVANALDERIWAYGAAPPRWQPHPMRILCVGSTTHARDLALIMPALQRLKADFAERVTIDVVGMTPEFELPPGIRRMLPPLYATQSYPAFVHWINAHTPGWHIGLAPLADTAFNRCKSPIKATDYAAMGLAVLASDMPVYRGSLADGAAGQLVANEPGAWLDALAGLVRDQALWRHYADAARAAFLDRASLQSQAAVRRSLWSGLLQADAPAVT